VSVLQMHRVYSRPNFDANVLTVVKATRPITAQRTMLPLLARHTDTQGHSWLQVRLPGRTLKRAAPPLTGWISASYTGLSTTSWHIVIDIRARRVRVYHNARRLRNYLAIVGSRSTPTPVGKYFIEENIRLPSVAAGAPFALATSARSTVLQEFAGGPGQIALHGRDHIGGRLGSAVSHGCIRLDRRAITWLAAHIQPGVPVTIV